MAADDLTRLAADVRREMGHVQDEAVKELQAGMQEVVEAAKANASWSRRIPASIKVVPSKTGGSIQAGGPDAPHAKTFEGPQGPVRVPVYGRGDRATWTWVTQAPRPYLEPAVEAKMDAVAEKAAEAIDIVFRRAGFK